MEAITILAIGFVCAACFLLGAKVGQAVSKGEMVELPNPAEAVREYKTKRKVEMEMSKMDTILHNIESYDGTATGQKDVPRG